MHRFFCSKHDVAADRVEIRDKKQLHHMRNVLRLKIKEKVTVCDDLTREHDCFLESISPDKAVFRITRLHQAAEQKQGVKVTIACAIPKKCKFDDIVDKLTQLGVDKIIPLLTQRVIVKWSRDKKELQRKRWEKIVLNAAKQSQRRSLPAVDSVKTIEEVLAAELSHDLKLIPALIGERKTLKEVLQKYTPGSVLILIGPEGDFTPEEVDLARRNGFLPVTLGSNVLRVDTAAIAAVSFVKLNENN